jgi:hypothetical protein
LDEKKNTNLSPFDYTHPGSLPLVQSAVELENVHEHSFPRAYPTTHVHLVGERNLQAANNHLLSYKTLL